jgi:hypothetical protein
MSPPVLVRDDGLSYWPADVWRSAPPDDVSIDGVRLARLVGRLKAGQEGAIQCLLVVRRGYLVTEQYFGWSASTPHTLQSVTKSVTSLLAGIAVSDDALRIDRPVLDIFPQYTDLQNLDARKRALTMRHLRRGGRVHVQPERLQRARESSLQRDFARDPLTVTDPTTCEHTPDDQRPVRQQPVPSEGDSLTANGGVPSAVRPGSSQVFFSLRTADRRSARPSADRVSSPRSGCRS